MSCIPKAAREEIHLRLVNWAAAMRTQVSSAPAPGLTPNELDAAIVELRLLQMKRYRSRLYRVLWQRYMARRGDVLAADTLRMPVHRFRDRASEAYRWLYRELPPIP